ncbi:Histone-lysine N-methyltransferase, H3 lysine-79 specific, partial [Ophiophagus hannah]
MKRLQENTYQAQRGPGTPQLNPELPTFSSLAIDAHVIHEHHTEHAGIDVEVAEDQDEVGGLPRRKGMGQSPSSPKDQRLKSQQPLFLLQYFFKLKEGRKKERERERKGKKEREKEKKGKERKEREKEKKEKREKRHTTHTPRLNLSPSQCLLHLPHSRDRNLDNLGNPFGLTMTGCQATSHHCCGFWLPSVGRSLAPSTDRPCLGKPVPPSWNLENKRGREGGREGREGGRKGKEGESEEGGGRERKGGKERKEKEGKSKEGIGMKGKERKEGEREGERRKGRKEGEREGEIEEGRERKEGEEGREREGREKKGKERGRKKGRKMNEGRRNGGRKELRKENGGKKGERKEGERERREDQGCKNPERHCQTKSMLTPHQTYTLGTVEEELSSPSFSHTNYLTFVVSCSPGMQPLPPGHPDPDKSEGWAPFPGSGERKELSGAEILFHHCVGALCGSIRSRMICSMLVGTLTRILPRLLT